MNKKNIVFVILIITLSLISYMNVFDNEFVWDDHVFILENNDIKSFANIPLFFKEDVDGLYRPLRSLHYTFAYSIFKKNPFGYHLNAVFFHTAISVLVFFIIKKIIENRNIALVASLIFAANPIHAERVANMTAGFDLLGIFLFLLSFYFYILYSKSNNEKNDKKYFIFSLLFFILALLASEEAITLPLIIILYEFSFNKEFDKKNLKNTINKNPLKSYLPFFAAAFFYLILRFFILGIRGRIETYLGGNFLITQLTMLKVYVKYIVLLLFPVNLTLFQEVPVAKGLFDAGVLVSLFVLSIILIFTIKNYRKDIVFFSVFWLFITLIPFSNIMPIQVFMAERYLYVPSIGFSLIISFLFFKIYNIEIKNIKDKKLFKNALIILFVLLLSFYSARTIIRNNDWQDNLSLWTKTIETNPYNSRAHDNLGFTYEQLGDDEKAFLEFQKAVELMPDNFRALSNLGIAYAKKKQYNISIGLMQKALRINPLHYKTHDKLGLVYLEVDDAENAIKSFERATEINPRYAKAYNDIAAAYGKIGEFEKVEENLKKAIKLDRDYADAHYNLGILYDFLGEKEKAMKEFEAAFKLEPRNELYGKKASRK